MNSTEMQNIIIRKYGFEAPETILFCTCAESFQKVLTQETKDNALQELFNLLMKEQ